MTDVFVRTFDESRPVDRVAGDAEVLRVLERAGIPAERVVRTAGRTLVTSFVEGTAATPDESTAMARRRGDRTSRPPKHRRHAVTPELQPFAGFDLPAPKLARVTVMSDAGHSSFCRKWASGGKLATLVSRDLARDASGPSSGHPSHAR